MRGWNPQNEHVCWFRRGSGGGGGKQRWSKPRKQCLFSGLGEVSKYIEYNLIKKRTFLGVGHDSPFPRTLILPSVTVLGVASRAHVGSGAVQGCQGDRSQLPSTCGPWVPGGY